MRRKPWKWKWWVLRPFFVVLAVLIVLVLLVGCGGGGGGPAPAPTIRPKPGAVPPPRATKSVPQAPGCSEHAQKEIEAGRGQAGICAPKPPAGAFRVSPSRAHSGPDVSNNDPFYNWHPVKAHGHPFAYDKINQGTRFIDSTAAGMTRAQRAAGLIPGGYDFLEVCRTSASGEARLFAARLKAIGLVRHAMVPIGDAEWPLSVPCSAATARSWLSTWASTVHSSTGRWPGFYTGAWWANPNLGCWRPPHGALRWVSGYTIRSLLSIPCGWGGVDLWQFTDAGFNGVTSTDMSVLEVPISRFVGLTPAQERAARVHSLRALERELRALHGLVDRHHCRKGKPWYGHAVPRRYHTLCEHWRRRGDAVTGSVGKLRHELGLRPLNH